MSTIWHEEPPFPAEHLGPGTTRYQLGPYWVDWNESGIPTEEMIAARIEEQKNPPANALNGMLKIRNDKAEEDVLALIAKQPPDQQEVLTAILNLMKGK